MPRLLILLTHSSSEISSSCTKFNIHNLLCSESSQQWKCIAQYTRVQLMLGWPTYMHQIDNLDFWPSRSLEDKSNTNRQPVGAFLYGTCRVTCHISHRFRDIPVPIISLYNGQELPTCLPPSSRGGVPMQCNASLAKTNFCAKFHLDLYSHLARNHFCDRQTANDIRHRIQVFSDPH